MSPSFPGLPQVAPIAPKNFWTHFGAERGGVTIKNLQNWKSFEANFDAHKSIKAPTLYERTTLQVKQFFINFSKSKKY